ncbi:MAG TPA: 3-dehydroquinate synthase [Candidatus Deferrimicrobiaceae bacterium]
MTLTPDTLTVALGDRAYDIFFGRDIYPLFQEWICRFYPGGTVHVVTDRNVASIFGADIRRWLSGIPHGVIELQPGEESKSFDTVREIYSFLARGDAGRDSLVVAFGGGVVGDLAGFASATYLRGISYIQVPTTLLSQVDSSVGGKTGFNLPEGKNLVGAFHQPRAVFIDDAFLLTLDERNLKAGMAEVVKSALAGDAELWSRLVARGGRWKSFPGEEWRWIVRRAVAFKASVVERDEREASLRRILNLGHTVGHAMEKAGGYGRLLHGEAVAAGLAWEAVLGRILGATPGSFAGEIVSLLLDMGYDLDDPGLPLSSIAAAIGMDKKRILSDVDLPLVAEPGRCELRRVPLPEIRRQLPSIRAELRERTTRHETRPAPEFPETALPPEMSVEELSSLERRVAGNPRDPGALTALAAGYRRAGKLAAAWEAIQAVLEENPADAAAQRVAAELGRAIPAPEAGEEVPDASPIAGLVLLGDDAYEIRPAEMPLPVMGGEGQPASDSRVGDVAGPAEDAHAGSGELAPEPVVAAEGPPPSDRETAALPPAVQTVTLAEVYWAQGERETANRIVDEILRRDPGNARALAWQAERREDPLEKTLRGFLRAAAKEYGYDLS